MLELYKWFQAERGRRSMLAALMGIVPSNISHWQRRGEIPWWWVQKVSEITGIPRWQLRPDMYEEPRNAD
jgi:DNA-binding transcriptional regulator YdaS (Cro superfamily)